MSVSAVKALLWAVIAVAVAMFFATASSAFDRAESLALFLAGCVLIVAAVFWYRRAIPDAESREEVRQAQQLAALKQQLALMGTPIAVKASNGMPVVVLLACVSIFYAFKVSTTPGVGPILLFVIVLVLTAGLAVVYLPRVGKPALTIQPDGLDTPVFGFLRWDEIESIDLQRYTSRGVTTHSLDLHVPQVSERELRMHPFLRVTQRALVRGARPGFVVIHLAFPSLPATLVHALCLDLWKERSGRAGSRAPGLSAQHAEQMRRLDEQLEMLKRMSPEAEPAEVIRLAEGLERQLADLSATQGVEQKAPKRLSGSAAARRDALLADLRKIDATDRAAVRSLLDRHAKAYSREMGVRIVVVVVVIAALVVVALALLGP